MVRDVSHPVTAMPPVMTSAACAQEDVCGDGPERTARWVRENVAELLHHTLFVIPHVILQIVGKKQSPPQAVCSNSCHTRLKTKSQHCDSTTHCDTCMCSLYRYQYIFMYIRLYVSFCFIYLPFRVTNHYATSHRVEHQWYIFHLFSTSAF